ncbi:MAG: dipeptide/oligopeptide/nickel ABC transporter ATP-binding protein [Cohaesibacter sp.]|nr:dipeptide/oligopeptide/nickel ABC transporter ATP-binding protein [Cohaesibacter sp.]
MFKTSTSLLEVSNLSANIGRQVVLSDISLDVQQGECVAIIGGSGAGKSCLLRCIMGLHKPAKPTCGQMIFADQVVDLTADRSLRSSQLGFAFVPQNPQAGLDPLKRLAFQWKQAVRCAGRQDMGEEEQSKLLTSLGLPEFGTRYPHEWSQGMQQRLLIAFALVARPKLLVLDEPTSALDPLIAAQTIMRVMAHAKEHDIATLIVTHDLALAARFANRLAILNTGRIVEFGSTTTLMEAPASDYGRLLVSNRHWSCHTRSPEGL